MTDRLPFVDSDPDGVDWRTPFIDGSFNFWELYDAGKWEPETKAVLERFLTPGSFFLDIGAWIGPVTLWATDLGADVVAYEPDPVAFEQIQHNTEDRNVLLKEAAVTRHGGPTHLTNPRFFGDSMSRVSDVGLDVDSVTVEEALGDVDWALVKVDIEGGEIDILPTLAPLCAQRGIPLYVSWHEPWWPDPEAAQHRGKWFSGFAATEGGWGSWDTLLAIPYSHEVLTGAYQ